MTRVDFEHKELKKGVSGLLRVWNEGPFIQSCICSCIDALDELIVVYNDCTDNSAEEIEKMRQRYPEKIKVYPYPYHVEKYIDADAEGGVSRLKDIGIEHLLSNYYNFALSKVSYQCAMKIDADQLYFTEEFANLTSLAKKGKAQFFLGYLVGGMMLKFEVSHKSRLVDSVFWWGYQSYAQYRFINNHDCLSLSGMNVLTYKGKSYIPLGALTAKFGFHYPYNGVGDHLLFWVDKESTYYEPWPILLPDGTKYWLIERFCHGNKNMFHMGAYWFHRSIMRKDYHHRVMEILNERQDIVMPFADFMKIERYKDVLKILRKPFSAPLYHDGISVRHAHNYTKNRAWKYISKLEEANSALDI